jgi:hypothetical protein
MASFIKNNLKKLVIKEEIFPEQIGIVFEPLDVDRAIKFLKVDENAKHDGEKETPHTSETNIDSFHLTVNKYIETEINQRQQRLNENLISLNKAIDSNDVKAEMEKAKNLVTLMNHQLESIIEEKRDDLTEAKETAEKITKDFNSFKTKNKLKREPKYPETYQTYIAILLALLLLETIMNGVFFADGHELGYMGGALLAFGIASINLSISFFLGRFTTYINHVKNGLKCIGCLSAITIFLWVFGYNLMVAHYRQQLGIDITKAGSAAIETLLKSPFALNDINYWVLFLIGLVFGLIAYGEGYFWDDPYPGFGQIHKRLKQAEEDFIQTKSEIMEIPETIKEEKLNELGVIESKINVNISYMKEIVEQKQSLVKNLNKNIEQIQSSSTILIQRYREKNRQSRKTNPPKYFSKKISHTKHEIEKMDFDKDKNLIQAQEEMTSEFTDMVENIKNSITNSYNQSFKSISNIDINWNKE